MFAFILRRPRPLLVALFGVAMFLAWFGLWVRVLPIKPRGIIRTPDGALPIGFLDGEEILVTCDPQSMAGLYKGARFWDLITGLERPQPDEPKSAAMTNWDRKLVPVLIDPRRNANLCAFFNSRAYFARDFVTRNARLAALRTDAEKVHVWDLPDDRELYVLKNLGGGLVSFSPDGRLLACQRNSEEIVLVEARSGQERRILRGCSGVPHQLAFSPDSRFVVGSYRDGVERTLRVWDVATGMQMAVLDDIAVALEVRFSADGQFLACAHHAHASDEVVEKLWDTSSWTERLALSPYVSDLDKRPERSFLSDGRLLLCNRFFVPAESATGTIIDSLRGPGSRQGRYVTKVWLVDPCSGVQTGPMIYGGYLFASPKGALVDCGPTPANSAELRIYDLPPRRPVELYLLLSALPTLLFTGLLWWRVR